jgi:hypothetical protein
VGRIWERPITYRAGTKTCPQPPAFACAACDCYTKSVSLSGNVCHVITGGQSANGRCRLIWESPGHVHQTLHVELPFVRHGEHDFIHDARFALRSFVGLGRGAEKRIGHGLRVRQRVPCIRPRALSSRPRWRCRRRPTACAARSGLSGQRWGARYGPWCGCCTF